MNSFDELKLSKPIRKAIAEAGYTEPTPIQAEAIPPLLAGRDLLGCAQTGTGKTAAFALPILHRLGAAPAPKKNGRRNVRALILTPTRELAAQILESFRDYGHYLPLKAEAVFGGVDKKRNEKKLRFGVDILVATPGRLLDLMNTRHVTLDKLEVFVLDEADHMLDMGFIHDVNRIIAALPKRRQSLFFSATMPNAVMGLANELLSKPVKIAIAAQSTPAESIEQSVFFVDQTHKDSLLKNILDDEEMKRVLIFTRTKHRADKVVRKLSKSDIQADAIHGNKTQSARTRTLKDFRNGKTRVLVATDIAARGIDINGITHVINYELPNEPESYVHRIGRTARAGRTGTAISFCAGDERDYLSDIEKTIRLEIDVVRTHSCYSEEAEKGLVNGQNGPLNRKRQAAAQRRGNQKRFGRDSSAQRSGSRSGRPQRKSRQKALGN